MRILLSRTDRIGDLILSTPAIASVRASFPDAHVTMVTSDYNRVVMERNTDVDELVSVARGERAASFGRRFRGYDLAIALAPRSADVRLVGATRARVRIGYTYVRRYVARLTARWYLNRTLVSEADPALCDRDPHYVVRHEVEQLLDLVAAAGARLRRSALRVDVTDADRAAVAHLPADPIVLHLGARWFESGSTLESTVQMAGELRALGAPLVVTVAPEGRFALGAFESAGVADALVLGLPFHQWAAAFERARCVVTVDTGATHVASAVRRPTVVAFEHRYFRLSSQEWAPYGVPGICIRKPEAADDASLARLREEVLDGVRTLMKHA